MTLNQELHIDYLEEKIKDADKSIMKLYKELAAYASEGNLSAYDACESTVREIKVFLNYRSGYVQERRGYIDGIS